MTTPRSRRLILAITALCLAPLLGPALRMEQAAATKAPKAIELEDILSWKNIGATALSLSQLKIIQEVITLTVFVPFAVLYMNQAIRLDFLWAGLCLLGAVYFTFRA